MILDKIKTYFFKAIGKQKAFPLEVRKIGNKKKNHINKNS